VKGGGPSRWHGRVLCETNATARSEAEALGVVKPADSDSLERQVWVEVMQVVDIACHDGGTLSARDEDDGSIDHIGRSRTTAKNACRFGENLVERRHGRSRSFDERA